MVGDGIARASGLENCMAGELVQFENGEFGTYTRYTYYRPESCVILTKGSKTLVLSGADRESTMKLYETLVQKTGRE